MAADDYYTIVGKILVFLYKKLKGKDTREIRDYIVPMSKDFPITEEYFQYVIEKLQEQGYVEHVYISKTMRYVIYQMDISDMRITPAGIGYMLENTTLRKVIEGLKEAAEIASLFKPL